MESLSVENSCVQSTSLEEYLQGTLAPDVWNSIDEHLANCDSCQLQLRSFEQQYSPPFAIDRPPAHFPFLQEAALGQLEAQACRIPIGAGAPLPKDKNLASRDFPAHIGQYTLLEKLGEGGMGAVYRARHHNLKCEVALKLLPAHFRSDRDHLARFYREMEAVGRVRSEHVVRATDAGESDGWHYLVMEYVPGIDVRRLIRAKGPLRIADACEIIRQAALGLVALEEHGLVHRDIKPSNLLLTQLGQVKILDLGLARLLSASVESSELTSSQQILGTLEYMAPEQCGSSHTVDIRADIYSLGCTFYKLLTAQSPFSGGQYQTPQAKLVGHLRDQPASVCSLRADIPAEIAAILERMIAKDARQRFASPAAVVQCLRVPAKGSDLSFLFGLSKQDEPENADDTASGDRLPSSTITLPRAVQPSVTKSRALRTGHWFAWGITLSIGIALAIALFRNYPSAATSDEQSPLNHPTTTAGKPEFEVEEDLPFDISQLQPLVWHNLFTRAPQLPSWQPPALDTLVQHLKDRRQVYISSRPYCFAQVGTIDHPKYRFQVRIDQTHWKGGCGIFLGMRNDVGNQQQRQARFQLLELRPAFPKDPLRAYAWHRLKGFVRFSAADTPEVSFESCVSIPIPRPTDSEQMLEVAVQRDGLTEFSWGGIAVPKICEGAVDAKFGAEDYSGGFGISIGNSDGMFRDASIILQ
ncbi:Serine/threonine-protein kinase StkP [Anatilimnocola aggregata]|uniref:Serine/threonine-protein kinase StkP n=1 Tax=Anatilimnocola aggregata TaxID=2528021 RepID=A0A517YNT2_9BACT|nr:serine/threonine-protein kinase [Anatilimnocola aggregata]QDU31869.1 Serine/threonine-protein kinase StkP [Anatilimnocola aggregata]